MSESRSVPTLFSKAKNDVYQPPMKLSDLDSQKLIAFGPFLAAGMCCPVKLVLAKQGRSEGPDPGGEA